METHQLADGGPSQGNAPPPAPSGGGEVEVSVVMPCLNEVRTLAACIHKAQKAFAQLQITGEVVVGDNGSTDGSQALAASLGARVIDAPKRGYGNAYHAAIGAARGKYIVMGDSDDSYDFGEIGRFLERLRAGDDFVMGSRFKGEIKPGAMPNLHRYFGNPVLTGILNLLFRVGISDAHCGMRAFTMSAWQKMGLRTGGMEFASEMIIRAAQEKLTIGEVPTTLHKDGRDRPPHLRSWRDGWRHLRFMLMFSPMWLYFIPSLVCLIPGLFLILIQPFVDITVGYHHLGAHFTLLGGTMTLLGLQLLQFGLYSKVIFVRLGIGRDRLGDFLIHRLRLEFVLVFGVLLTCFGLGVDIYVLVSWIQDHFGDITSDVTERVVMASTMVVVGVQLLFACFFLGILRASSTGAWAD